MPPRKPFHHLTKVPSNANVLRLIEPDDWDFDASDGPRLEPGFLERDKLLGDSNSYGESCYVESDAPGIWTRLKEVDPDLASWGAARIQVQELKKVELDVRYSPEDCDYRNEPDIVAVHASIHSPRGKLKKSIRNQLLNRFEVIEPPRDR